MTRTNDRHIVKLLREFEIVSGKLRKSGLNLNKIKITTKEKNND